MPAVLRHAEFAFRHTKDPHTFDDRVQETLCLCWIWACRLWDQGKDARAFPTALAASPPGTSRAGAASSAGRPDRNDALSPLAHASTVLRPGTARAPDPPPPPRGWSGSWTSPAAASRSWPPSASTSPPGSQSLRRATGPHRRGHGAWGRRRGTVASPSGVSPGRVSQLRREFKEDWAPSRARPAERPPPAPPPIDPPDGTLLRCPAFPPPYGPVRRSHRGSCDRFFSPPLRQRSTPVATSTLIAHCGASVVTRDELARVKAPEPTRTWYPLAHTRGAGACRNHPEGGRIPRPRGDAGHDPRRLPLLRHPRPRVLDRRGRHPRRRRPQLHRQVPPHRLRRRPPRARVRQPRLPRGGQRGPQALALRRDPLRGSPRAAPPRASGSSRPPRPPASPASGPPELRPPRPRA